MAESKKKVPIGKPRSFTIQVTIHDRYDRDIKFTGNPLPALAGVEEALEDALNAFIKHQHEVHIKEAKAANG